MTREEAINEIKSWDFLEGKEIEAIHTLIPELKESEDERIRKEINTLYSEIDTCISELIKARTDKDSKAEGKALFKMEGLMVATLQDLSCIEDYLEKKKEPEKDVETRWENDTLVVDCSKQKPAWNGDDEKMLKSIIGDLFCGTDFNMELKFAASKKVNWLKDKLKSIRPDTLLNR